MKPVVSYQPQLPPPAISIQSYSGNSALVNITSQMDGVNFFFKLPEFPIPLHPHPDFTEIQQSDLPLDLFVGTTVKAYVAKVGYNNSEITVYTIPPSPTG